MARRKDHSRDQLHTMALDAAREIAEEKGLRGVTARRIAAKIGYSAGTLYNIFENLDDLIAHLNVSTLDRLYEACRAVPIDGEPEAALKALAGVYIGFTEDHPQLWSVLFERSAPHGEQLPDWYHEKVRRLLALLETAMAPLFPPGQEVERLHSARVLWTGLHGICSLSASGAMATFATPTAMADTLITNYIGGLRHGYRITTDV